MGVASTLSTRKVGKTVSAANIVEVVLLNILDFQASRLSCGQEDSLLVELKTPGPSYELLKVSTTC